MSEQNDKRLSSAALNPRSVFVILPLLAAAAAAVTLAGGFPQGSLGIFLCVLGGALLAGVPTAALPRTVWIAAALFVAACGMSLLPAAFGPQPEWRSVMEQSGLFGALDRITLNPVETGFWLGLLALSVLAGLFVLSQPPGFVTMTWFATLASVFCAGYGIAAILAETRGWKMPIDAGEGFGFFANRNHAAALVAVGGVAGLGGLAGGIVGRRYMAAVLASVSVGACAWTVLLESPSRGAAVFFAVATVLWLGGLGRQRWTAPVAVAAVCLAAVATMYFVATENPLAARLLGSSGDQSDPEGVGVLADFRLEIYEDTVRMVKDWVVTGSGLGTFRIVFPHYADASLTEASVIHPEGSWLMLAAEAGVPAVLLVFTLLIAVVWGMFRLRAAPEWPVRWALVCAGLLAALHSLVDVPLHRIELGWWVLIVACVGLARPVEGETLPAKPRGIARKLFVAGGAISLVWGVSLIAAEWFGAPSNPVQGPRLAMEPVRQLYEARELEPALAMARLETLRWPLDDQLRFLRGVLALNFVGTDAEVESEFRAARLLRPNDPQMAADQGMAWAQVDPMRARPLWFEAVERQARIDRARGREGPPGLRAYTGILNRIGSYPQLLEFLRPDADAAPALHLAWARRSPSPGAHLARIAGSPGFVSGRTQAEREEFLGLWAKHDDGTRITQFLAANPGWSDAAWVFEAGSAVRAGAYEEAVRILGERHGVGFQLPEDPSAGGLPGEIAALLKDRNEVAARRLIAEAAREAAGKQREEALRLSVALAAHGGDWETAYRELLNCVRLRGEDPLPGL